MRQINKQQSNKHKCSQTIEQILDRFTTKKGKNNEETQRKYNAILHYINAIGLSIKDKYSKIHNEQTLLKIVATINNRTDMKGDQKIRHVRWINELIKFAVSAYPDTYKIDVLISQPSIKRTPKSAKRPHTPYNDNLLKRIFDPNRQFFHKYPDMFWGCMIALFTGSRKNAIFTLQYKDIIQRNGIWCINFISDYPGIKQLKTEDSERIVPIHSTLIKMGFLDYIQQKPHDALTDFIFKSVCFTSSGNLNSHMARKFFCFLENIGIRDKSGGHYDFHSFRKNANITMEKCGIIRSYIDKIIGWQSRGSEGERSYSNYTIKQISEQLELLHYDCLKNEFKEWTKIMWKNKNRLELCGSTTDCNSFVADEYLGTSSVKSQKDGSIYRVTGMISFGSIKMGDATGTVEDGGKILAPGEIGVQNYIRQVKKNSAGVPNAEGIISSIEEELNNIAGTINRSISLIESDTRIQYCINGRDLSQIKGGKKGKNQTEARFPNLLNQYRVMIAMAALRKAQDNYNKKVSAAIEEASKNSSLEIAEYLCKKMADIGNTSSDEKSFIEKAPLTPPFAISYDVGAGLDINTLASMKSSGSDKGDSWDDSMTVSGVKTSKTATFDKQTRICHVCTTRTIKECKKGGTYHWNRNDRKCSVKDNDPVCEDVTM